tara:strand:- start:703 stop:1284 length:582 start_codon:yes stop_codon:yes gene_type:complete
MKNRNKYRWFYTSSGKLVVGGKNAGQNDELMKKIINSNQNYFVMHTSHPGSPFSVLMEDIEKISKKDLRECAIFTGCFSRAWKEKKKKTEVHLFNSKNIFKKRGMKVGTWGVSEKISEMKIDLKLALVKQKKVYRAVPEISAKKSEILLKVCPGKIDKVKSLDKFKKELKDEDLDRDEILSALPAGGVRICKK